jgi:hypothetical protein
MVIPDTWRSLRMILSGRNWPDSAGQFAAAERATDNGLASAVGDGSINDRSAPRYDRFWPRADPVNVGFRPKAERPSSAI